jgi:hypothetical protein
VINGSKIIVGGEMKICWNFGQNNSEEVIVNNIAYYSEDGWQDLGHDGFRGNVSRMIINNNTLYTIGKYGGLGYFLYYYENTWQIVIIFSDFFYFLFLLFIFFLSSWQI